jgi:hypothetical protein
MRAELTGIGSGRARWRFALGCVLAVAAQPMVLRGTGYPLLVVGVLGAVVAGTGTVTYAPLRWGFVVLVSILVAVSWLGRRRGVLEIVDPYVGVLFLGCLVAAALAFVSGAVGRAPGDRTRSSPADG